MKNITALHPDALYRRCDTSSFAFQTTAELDDLPSIVGQPRAMNAVEFGMGMRKPGYNLFVLGPPGAGKHTMLRQHLEKLAHGEARPPEWCYVNNFNDPNKPRALRLPLGRAGALRADMQQFIEELRAAIPATFDSEEYRAKVEQIDAEFREQEAQALNEIGEDATKDGIALLRTPAGFSFAPVKDNEVISPDEYNQLPQAQREHMEGTMAALRERLEKVIRQAHVWHRQRRDRLRALNREVTQFAVGHLTDELKERYQDLPEVAQYLDAVREDVIENVDDFRKPGETPAMAFGPAAGEPANLRRYQVNVLVEHSAANGAPVRQEDHPTFQNLIGRVEHLSQFGALVTDFGLIKPGALHLANGGYLLIDVHKLFAQPYAWEGLKRALLTGAIAIESLGQMYSLISTVSLEPEPIPLNIKVVLFGDRYAYYLLSAYDPDFSKLFKVAADFEDEVARSPEHVLDYARLIATVARKEALKPFDRTAVARVIEWSSRLAGDAEKLSTHLQALADVLHEADHWAGAAGRAVVSAEDIERTIKTQIYRLDRLRERSQEAILRNILLIDTDGVRVGQVNGLSVVQLGDFAFAHPTRVTAATRLGDGEVIDIQREVALGGPLHSKGVLTLSAFLAARYAQSRPLSLSASITLEQTYGQVEGDSASVAELCALVSSIAEVPIKQSLAVTGSVNQWGQVQAIGGVNEKIEGFFDICAKRGLNHSQGVLIPAANVGHLMLRDDVVAAVAAQQFWIYPIATVDEALELLTGIPAGEPNARGEPSRGSVNYLVSQRLQQFSKLRLQYARGERKDVRKLRRGRADR
jgi:lon-related putative ATP-dependent protease